MPSEIEPADVAAFAYSKGYRAGIEDGIALDRQISMNEPDDDACEACGLPVDDRFAHRAPSGIGWVHDRCCTQPDCRQLLELVRKATR